MADLPYIPYFTTSRYRVDTMIELADPKPRETVADLGSGDGRILIAFAEKGVEMHGFELDEDLIKTSEINILNAFPGCHPGLVSGSLSHKFELNNPYNNSLVIHQTDFWSTDLSPYDIITCYPMPDILIALEEKLRKELKPGTKILLNYYPFPTWQYEKTKDHIYIYVR